VLAVHVSALPENVIARGLVTIYKVTALTVVIAIKYASLVNFVLMVNALFPVCQVKLTVVDFVLIQSLIISIAEDAGKNVPVVCPVSMELANALLEIRVVLVLVIAYKMIAITVEHAVKRVLLESFA